MKLLGRLRRHLSPLSADSISPLNLPPVRLGLLLKLNLLTIGLIFLTAVAISTFHFMQQWRGEDEQLKSQGTSMLAIMISNRHMYVQFVDDQRQHTLAAVRW